MASIFQQHFALSHRLCVVAASVFCAPSIIHSKQMNISSSAGLLPLTSITWWCLSFLLCLLFFLHLSHPLLLDVVSEWIFMYRACVCCLWTLPDWLPLGPLKKTMLTSCSVICGPGSLFMAQVYFVHVHVCVHVFVFVPLQQVFLQEIIWFHYSAVKTVWRASPRISTIWKTASLWMPLLKLLQLEGVLKVSSG